MSQQPEQIGIERTVVIVKPDGVIRGLTGEIIKRIEQRGLKIIALKMVQATAEHIDNHYPKDEAWVKRLGEKAQSGFDSLGLNMKDYLGTDDHKEVGRQVRQGLLDYMTMAPIIAIIVEGSHAIESVRKIMGVTFPFKAEPGSIRGDYSVDSPTLANTQKRPIFNLVHASENVNEANNEIDHWFAPEEIHDYFRSDHVIAFGDRRPTESK